MAMSKATIYVLGGVVVTAAVLIVPQTIGTPTFLILMIPVLFLVKFLRKRYDDNQFKKNVSQISAERGLNFNYTYGHQLALDSNANVLFISNPLTGEKAVVDKSDVKDIEFSSMLQTTYNQWGKAFHKNKLCKIMINTRSLDVPIHTVSFKKKQDMDVWYQRISTVFNLT